MRAGTRTIQGTVAPREQARVEYDTARLEGRTAALLEQERPNLFTQQLGNIPPGTDVVVELTIDHPLEWVAGGAWEWRFPTVVAPRYLGAPGTVPDHQRVTVDVTDGPTSPTVSLTLSVVDALQAAPSSPTHAIDVADRTVTLAGSVALDRDIVVRWTACATSPGCSVRTKGLGRAAENAPDRAYGLLTIVPPSVPEAVVARDLVLLLDVSGSMTGTPLARLKDVVTAAIDTLSESDRLEMIAFASHPVRYKAEAVFVSDAEKQRAIAWVQRLAANGGTDMIPAIGEALRPAAGDSRSSRRVSRQVLVVTDGLIGFEADAVRAIRDGLPPGSRLHAVGIGSAANRAFLSPAARAGRGVEVVIDVDEPASRAAEAIVAATREPVVIDVALEGTALAEPAPRLPDLLSGAPVLAALRLRPSGGSLVVRGRTSIGTWEEQLSVAPVTPKAGADNVPALWARAAIEELELDLACGGKRATIDRRIEEIALAHSIASRLTSWVAVATEPSVDPRAPVRRERIPQALPYGMQPHSQVSGPPVVAGFMGRMTAASLRMTPDMAPPEDTMAQLQAPRSDSAGGAARLLDRFRDLLSIWRRADRAERRDIEAHRSKMMAQLKELAREGLVSADDLERLRQQIRDDAELADSVEVVHGQIVRARGKTTTTVEFQIVSRLDWQPSPVAYLGDRPIAVVEDGTTERGRVEAGSLVRLELRIAPDVILGFGRLEIAAGDRTLIVRLEAERS